MALKRRLEGGGYRAEPIRRAAGTAKLYGSAARRVFVRARPWNRGVRAGESDRHVFVVGSPRSGTTFIGGILGAQPGLVDLGEVTPLKAAIPELARLSEAEAAARVRRIVETVRRLGLATHLRAVEQTPETAFVLAPVLRAFPRAHAVHMLRDGRDVVCSLLERGWLSAHRTGRDDALLPYGARARFWVEEDRREEFERVSDARRAAWAWRRYVAAARVVSERTLELRYEQMVRDHAGTAERLATALDLDAEPLRQALPAAHPASVGRWRRDLTAEQLRDVEEEAGSLLRALGYE